MEAYRQNYLLAFCAFAAFAFISKAILSVFTICHNFYAYLFFFPFGKFHQVLVFFDH